MLRVVALSIVALTFAFAACGNPCNELADLTCEAAGEQSLDCDQIRKKAEEATDEDKRACEIGLKLVKDLDRSK